MTEFEKVKAVIEQYFDQGRCGLFDCPNICGDNMDLIYANGDVSIWICYGWEYFEVCGLSHKEFAELDEWYENKRQDYRKAVEAKDGD